MRTVGIRALKQNASAVVAEVAGGEVITITDRGRPVARLGPLRSSALDDMIADGRARPPRRSVEEVPAPEPGPSLSEVLSEMRREERF